MATQKEQCSICRVTTDIYACRSCSKDFCFGHLSEHRKEVNTKREKIQTDIKEFQQVLPDQQQQPVLRQIDQWEKDSIATIQKTADQYRTKVINYTKKMTQRIDTTLNQQILTNVTQAKCHEIIANRFAKQLQTLKTDLKELKITISIEQQPTSFIPKLIVQVPTDRGKINPFNSILCFPCQTLFSSNCSNERTHFNFDESSLLLLKFRFDMDRAWNYRCCR